VEAGARVGMGEGESGSRGLLNRTRLSCLCLYRPRLSRLCLYRPRLSRPRLRRPRLRRQRLRRLLSTFLAKVRVG
jgi:hypothetical protein